MGHFNPETLHRVFWIMEEGKPFVEPDLYSNHQLKCAIMQECGSSDRTVRDRRKQMVKLGIIESAGLGLWKKGTKSGKRSDFGYGEEEEQKVLSRTTER